MADDLTYHGDLNAALRRMLQQGFRDRNGEQLMGLREMLERLRQRRREEVESKDLGGPFAEIAERLREILDEERAGIDRRLEQARESGDQRRQEIVEDLASQRHMELDLMPPDLGSMVQSMQQYDFMDDSARQHFEELMDELRSQLLQNTFNRLSEGMQNMTPEQMGRMKDMLADLNRMLEARERGEEPNFQEFMDKHGDFFPGDPQSLDELLEQMAMSMAAMQQLMNSMTPEQRAQLQQLSEALLDDMDLRWQMDELGRNLQAAFPDLPWQQSMRMQGDQPMGLGDMSQMLQTLGDLDQLEQFLQNATQPGQLAEVDLDSVSELLGDDAARSLERLREMRERVRVGKISGAVGTHAHLDPRVEKSVCEKLGLKAAALSTQIIQRDRHAEFMTTLAIIASSIDRWATEFRHLQRTELREAEEPFRAGKQKGSSAMPHKRNPVKSEQLCGLARILRGYPQPALENVALWHERDISHSSVERVILPDSCILTHYVMVQAERLVDGLVVYPERMLENLDGSFGLVFSQPVLLALVESGLSRDDAYRLVQRNAMATWEQRRPFIEVLRADAEVTAALADDRLVACFDLTKALAHTSRTFDVLDATLAQPLA